MKEIKNEISKGNYWEHFKIAKDLRLVVDANSERLKNIEKSMNEIQLKIK